MSDTTPSLAEVIALSEKALRMALQHIRICAPNATVEAALESVNLSAILSTASLPTITVADLNAEYCKGRNEGWDAAKAKYTRTSAASLRDEDADTARLDWLESQQGSNLVSDDDCRWAVSTGGFQPVPEDGGFTEDVSIVAFVSPEEWKPNIRAAIDHEMAATQPAAQERQA